MSNFEPETENNIAKLIRPDLPYLKARLECCLQEVYWRLK